MTRDPELTRSEAADNYTDARRQFGRDSAEAEEAAEALERLLARPEGN